MSGGGGGGGAAVAIQRFGDAPRVQIGGRAGRAGRAGLAGGRVLDGRALAPPQGEAAAAAAQQQY